MRLRNVFDDTRWETKPSIYSLREYMLPLQFVLLSTIIVSHARDTLLRKCHLHPTLPQAPTVHAGP